MFSVYLIFVLLLVAFYLVGLLIPGKKRVNPNIKLDELTVVIPFRNEVINLPTLLRSIKKQSAFPAQIIFVNDHSEDDFHPLFSDVNFAYQLLDLGPETGKKAALKHGISQAKGQFILTLDADVELPPGYFSQMEHTPQGDLMIFPVKMKSDTFPALFATFDFYFLNALNLAIFRLGRPIVANGANLFFRKECYGNMLKDTDSQHVSSGDDMFLLQSVLKQGGAVDVVHKQELIVTTAGPSSWEIFLHQRLRWIGKTKHIKDPLANFVGVLGLLYHLSAFAIIAFCPHYYWVLAIKVMCDVIVLLPHLVRMKQLSLFLFSPFFTLLYPLYLLVLAIAFLLFTPEWKQRKVKQ